MKVDSSKIYIQEIGYVSRLAIQLPVVILCLACPFNKVEESFNTQAVHDVIFHRFNLSDYDHHQNPGPVPRTFIGPLILAFTIAPLLILQNTLASIISLIPFFSEVFRIILGTNHRLLTQIFIRLHLGLAIGREVTYLTRVIKTKFSTQTFVLFLGITVTQFHYNFYASRLLPNTFAVFLTLKTISSCLLNDLKSVVKYGVISIVVFRSELVIFYGPMIAFMVLEQCQDRGITASLVKLIFPVAINMAIILGIGWYTKSFELFAFMFVGGLVMITKEVYDRKKELSKLIEVLAGPFVLGIVFTLLSIILTSIIDSYLWNKNFPFWPELNVFVFNAVNGGSTAWGTLPFTWYFLKAIPKLFQAGLIFLPFCVLSRDRKKCRLISMTSLIFVFIYSFLGHKELRFIIYITPMVNLCIAVGVKALLDYLKPTRFQIVRTLIPIGLISLNLIASIYFCLSSKLNYPGGEALFKLHQVESCSIDNKLTVFMDNYVAQTGASRFGYMCEHWAYTTDYGTVVRDVQFNFVTPNDKNSIILAERTKELIDEFGGTHGELFGVGSFGGIGLKELRGFEMRKLIDYLPFIIEEKDKVVALRLID